MMQLSFADIPIARRNDPASSYRARQIITDIGLRGNQCRTVYNLLKMYGPCTSKELAEKSNHDRHMVGRRLPDLLRNGLVERCEQEKGDCVWRVK